MYDITLSHYLIVGAFLFIIGSLLVLTRRNGIFILIGLELMINATLINFVSFSHFDVSHKNGEVASLFIIVLAVCASVVGLVILMKVYKLFHTIYVDEVRQVKE
ncbi:MAG TPA: NADH-quinone oxidoreductase subunit NuoK [Cytophagaceae bacterium]|jgi:NADH:ubiquinone oxidoreductase subunit K|nr:NADH-quinone oxidoreductase subunit NuoK [Cytophagaceae bacterium]